MHASPDPTTDDDGSLSATPERDARWNGGQVVAGEAPAPGGVRSDIVLGMTVAARDGRTLGTVRQLRPTALLIDRPRARDVWAPFAAIREVAGTRVVLDVLDPDGQDWEHPPLGGGEPH